MAREGGARTWSDLGRQLNIHSYQTAQAYKDIWHQFGHFAKETMGLRDMEKVTGEHIKTYLESRIADGIKLSTFQKESAALSKFENAMNMFAERTGSDRSYEFRSSIDEVRQEASQVLERGVQSRAYENPGALIDHIKDNGHRIAASIQYESGARLYEVSLIHRDQLEGIGKDPITNKDVGNIRLDPGDTKGGKGRMISVTPDTYRDLETHINTHGEYRVEKSDYYTSLQDAAESSGQQYNGSHGLRWNFAQERFAEVQQNGYTYEQAMSQVSWEMGHERPDITLHYLR